MMADRGGGSPPGTPFEGFREDSIEKAGELNYKLTLRKFKELEGILESVLERLDVLEKGKGDADRLAAKVEELESENVKLRKENEKLRKEMMEVKGNNGVISETLDNVKKEQNEWKQVNKKNEQSLKNIMEEQQREKKEIKQQVVETIKEKEKLVRTTVDRVKCIVVYGVEEEKVDNRLEREEKEKNKIKKVLTAVRDDAEDTVRQVEEYYRLGRYEEGRDRPIKIKFATQSCAEETVNSAWKLANVEELRKVWICKDMNLEERETQKGLVLEAKEKNEQRTEEEKKKFYWKVRDLRLRKNYYRR